MVIYLSFRFFIERSNPAGCNANRVASTNGQFHYPLTRGSQNSKREEEFIRMINAPYCHVPEHAPLSRCIRDRYSLPEEMTATKLIRWKPTRVNSLTSFCEITCWSRKTNLYFYINFKSSIGKKLNIDLKKYIKDKRSSNWSTEIYLIFMLPIYFSIHIHARTCKSACPSFPGTFIVVDIITF